MRIDIITCLPRLLEGPLSESIVSRAVSSHRVEIVVHDLRDFTADKNRSTDDYAYGGGAGMVMTVEPIDRCISALRAQRAYDDVIYMSPDGPLFSQVVANELSLKKNLILLCGHYKGVDERVREHLVTREISIGNYVLSGGELAAAVVVDAVVRLLPGAISDETSALTDSYQDGLVAPPVYSRPADYKGWKVPEVLLSGNEARIEEWRHERSLERTKQRRPELLK
jgi:tRNA (guanine37-N1)-methyltransferase